MMENHSGSRWSSQPYRYLTLALMGPLVCAMVLGQDSFTESWATTIYSYVDDQGNLAYTDEPEKIPEKYRAKVKTHERPAPVQKSSSLTDSVQSVKDQSKNFAVKARSFHADFTGLNASQLEIVNYAGAVAILLLLVMYLFRRSPMVRLLAFGLLIVLGIGAPLLMYSSDGGPMDIMKRQAVEAEQAQSIRLQQIPE